MPLDKKEIQKEIDDSSYPKVLFYTSIPRTFRTTLIGHLYEISQLFPVILLSEELDSEIKKILFEKKLPPKLKEIIPIHQYTGEKRNLLAKNIYLYKLAKDVIKPYKPDIVITPNYKFSFEKYFLRLAKRAGANTLCFHSAFFIKAKDEDVDRRYSVLFAYSLGLSFLPFSIIRLLWAIKREFQKAFFNWLLPILVGEKPFLEKDSELKYIDRFVVFTKEIADEYIAAGFPKEKIVILSHPLTRVKADPLLFKKRKYKPKTIVLFYPSEKVGVRKDNYKIIPKREMFNSRIEAVRTIAETLKDWKIFIKPHPLITNLEEIKKIFKSVSEMVEVTDPKEQADKYIGMANVITGFPVHGMEIYTAFLSYPEKPVIAINLSKELLGDDYKDFEGVEYVDSKEKLIKLLELIRDNKYQKKYKEPEKRKLELGEFANTVELLKFLSKSPQRG